MITFTYRELQGFLDTCMCTTDVWCVSYVFTVRFFFLQIKKLNNASNLVTINYENHEREQ